MPNLGDLQIHINGQQIFILNEKVMSKYCGRLMKILNHQKRRCDLGIEINDFPGGPHGFELVSRFCYNNGNIPITASNVLILHCCALYLGMTEEVFTNNLLQKTQKFLDGIYVWKWNDILVSLKSCDILLYTYAYRKGLLEKMICALLAKITQNSSESDINLPSSNPSSSSSPESHSVKRFSSSTKTTPKTMFQSILQSKAWWFEDLSTLPPKIVENLLQIIGAYKTDNKNLIFTRFLLHYLKSALAPTRGTSNCRNRKVREYAGLAETAAYGVIFYGKRAFSCRGLFWELRILSEFGLNRDCRIDLEKLIGGVLDEATLDDLLVSGNHMGLYYDVDFVTRLNRLFVDSNDGSDGVCVEKLKKVGRLMDKYLREISPDQNLNISKFLGIAECLPDSARDCFDGVYRAIDIYLESHARTTFEERSRLCSCLNYYKLSFEACKDLAKNPRIPPRIAMQALISQQAKIPAIDSGSINSNQIILNNETNTDNFLEVKEDMKLNLERMQRRVRELEMLCHEMKVEMSRFASHNFLC